MTGQWNFIRAEFLIQIPPGPPRAGPERRS
jgi:hypothetical protein